MKCERFNECKNNDLCYRCRSYSLFRTKPKARVGRVKNSKKEGMSFQRKVGRAYDIKTGKQSIQQPNSGALWFAPGDVITEEFLIECKERKLTARGEKQFTITKEMLDKIDKEAGSSRPGVLAFGFKGTDDIYLVADYNIWLDLVQQNNQLKSANEKLSKQLEALLNQKESEYNNSEENG
jgi:hypothetical protein